MLSSNSKNLVFLLLFLYENKEKKTGTHRPQCKVDEFLVHEIAISSSTMHEKKVHTRKSKHD